MRANIITAKKDIGALRAEPNHLWLRRHRVRGFAFTKLASAIFVAVGGLFIAARLWNLTAYDLWYDEIFSVLAARHDWRGLIAFVVEDVVHPPLFYMLLKVWMKIGGESLLWLKLFPALTSIAAIVPFYLLCRELRLRDGEVNLALMLMAVNGYLIYYAQELRMYSLLLFFSLCSVWLFVRFFNSESGEKTPLLILFAANLLLVYTHYYGWMIVGVEFIFLLFWKRQKVLPFSISLVILTLCFSPWIYAVMQAAIRKGGLDQNIGWIPRPDLDHLIGFYATLNGPFALRRSTSLGFVLFGGPILVWAWHVLRKKGGEDTERAATFWWLFLLSFLPIAIAFSASQVLPQSIWIRRHLIIVAVPYMILVAVAVYRLRPDWMRTTAVFMIIGWATMAGFKDPHEFIGTSWRRLIHQLIQAEPADAIGIKVYVLTNKNLALPLRFYLESANEKRFQIVPVKDMTALDGDHFWIAFRESDSPMKRGFLQKLLIDRGYEVGEAFKEGPIGYEVFLFPVRRR